MVAYGTANLKKSLYTADSKHSKKIKATHHATLKRCVSIESVRSIQQDQTKLKVLFQTLFQKRKRSKENIFREKKERSFSDADKYQVHIKKVSRSQSEADKLDFDFEKDFVKKELYNKNEIKKTETKERKPKTNELEKLEEFEQKEVEEKLNKFHVSETCNETQRSKIVRTENYLESNKRYSNSTIASYSTSASFSSEENRSYSPRAFSYSSYQVPPDVQEKREQKKKKIEEYLSIKKKLNDTNEQLNEKKEIITKLEANIEDLSQSEYSEVLREENKINAEIESIQLLMKSVRNLTIEQKKEMTRNMKQMNKMDDDIRIEKEHVDKFYSCYRESQYVPKVVKKITTQKRCGFNANYS